MLLGDAVGLESFRGVPVIVIGGEDSDAVDRVRAFARGCDDFVARPFVYDELVARINAVLRRAKPAQRERLDAGPISIERPTRRVTVRGARVELAASEYELLLKLAGEPQRVFTKEELLREVWGFRSLGRTRTLDSHASRLRRKLQAVDPGPFVDQRLARRLPAPGLIGGIGRRDIYHRRRVPDERAARRHRRRCSRDPSATGGGR